MITVDSYESVPDLLSHPIMDRISKRFDNIFCHGQTTTNLVPDSIYIYNSLNCGMTLERPKVVPIDVRTTGAMSEQLSMVALESNLPTVFKIASGKVIAQYSPIDNVLVTCDFTHVWNSFSVSFIEKIMDWMENNTPEKTILEDIIQPRKEATITIGNHSFVMRCISSSPNHRDDFVREVNSKARDSINKIREQWAEALKREKERYERLRKSTKAMPALRFEDAMTQDLKMSIIENKIVYSFAVKFTVKDAIDEAAKKKVGLDAPIDYDVMLHFYVNEKDLISEVRLTNKDGKTSPNHLHAVPSGAVCVGSTDLIGKKVSNVTELFSHKDQLVHALKTFNVYSCYPDSNRELYDSIKEKMKSATPSTMGMWSIKLPTSSASTANNDDDNNDE